MIERIREEIADLIWQCEDNYEAFPGDHACSGTEFNKEKFLDKVLKHKVGSLTLKELIEKYEKGELLEKADNQDLPENEDIPKEFNELACGAEDDSDNVARACYLLAQQDMLKDVWVKCKVKELEK